MKAWRTKRGNVTTMCRTKGKRTGRYRLRMVGTGGCRVYSVVREYYDGSALKSQRGRQ